MNMNVMGVNIVSKICIACLMIKSHVVFPVLSVVKRRCGRDIAHHLRVVQMQRSLLTRQQAADGLN
jgi:hypothetical protein